MFFPEHLLARPQTSPSAMRSQTPKSHRTATNYERVAADRVRKYRADYPGIEVYPPRSITLDYPIGSHCLPTKQAPFIILMMQDKIAARSTQSILGEATSANLTGNIYGDSKDAQEYQQLFAFTAANIAAKIRELDENRPVADRNKQVLYQYRVQFNPATCKNQNNS